MLIPRSRLSKSPVQSSANHRYRAAIPVEGRVADKLVINGAMNVPPDLKIIIGFQDFLPTVGQCSVPRQLAHRPMRFIQFHGNPGNITQSIRWIVPSGVCDQTPIHELCSRIIGIGIASGCPRVAASFHRRLASPPKDRQGGHRPRSQPPEIFQSF